MGYTAFQEFIYLYKRYGMPHLRPGQFFVSRYIKNTWPELFYEKDENKAFDMIKEWLLQHHYDIELPQAVYKVEEQNFKREKSSDEIEPFRKDLYSR